MAKTNTLITLLFLLSISLIGQEKPPTTCQHHSHNQLEQLKKEYYEQNKDFIDKIVLMPPTNVRAYTQSIHNVIVKWDSGSFQSFRIGTAPGLQDIKWGQGLRATDKHTRGAKL